ncbi:AGC protein kinase [Aphanomyces invadans]|uniref:AGC protein kinase n=1 Tax=Aphanomyces invadans TaxID=157072 RepID=A0A024UNN4_9STRA|nr:AGC protein kinase [Aphanomyces invadans]ETW07253.1 AGC protein kinase [Aphanomyces invadans]|eukprot:XP_008863346.1 AGC protein kinase [Aphanomyces invadans]
MPVCGRCNATKGFNKFHALEKLKAQPTCKDCIKIKDQPVALSACVERTEAESSAQEDTPVASPSFAPAKEPPIMSPPGSKKKGVSVDDFVFLRVIGKGTFGKVLMVRHKKTEVIYAMKVISKQFLVDMDSVKYMKSERNIMTKIHHPFVIGLEFAFQTESKVYLVMEYQPGGELFSHLKKEGLLMEDKAKFYLAEMILALEHLHLQGIIHRDLKPENVLISAQGHVKLTDFGLAKQVNDGDELYTFCGTQEYMAPEMVLGNGYSSAVDWWSLGALAYEMLVGHPPFETKNKNRKELHKKILTAKLVLPKWLSSEAHSLLKSLLERNIDKRLGGGKSTMFVVRGVQALKCHPFFRSIDWNAIAQLKTPPPMVPRVNHETDTSNFDTEFTGLPATDLTCGNFDGDNETFRGFSFYGHDELDIVDDIESLVLHRTRSLSRRASKEFLEVLHTDPSALGGAVAADSSSGGTAPC